jgi:ligand-binding sensor protein
MKRDLLVRFAIILVAVLPENLWLVLRWAVVAHPRQGGHDLPIQFTFKTFCDWIRHELEEKLRRQWSGKANGIESQRGKQGALW